MTEEQRSTGLREIPAAVFKNKWIQLFAVIFALLELYNHGAIPAYITTQKGIETKAVAENAELRKKAEAAIAEQKAITEGAIATNAERKHHAEAMKATADGKRADAEATIARETANNAIMKAEAEKDAAKGEADIKEQQVTVERERAVQAQRLKQAEAANAEYRATTKLFAAMFTNNRLHLDTGGLFDEMLSPGRRH